MAWGASDRAVKAAERFGLEGAVAQWRRPRDAVHTQVCDAAYDVHRNSFVQH